VARELDFDHGDDERLIEMNICSITEPDEVFDDERGYGNF
jgi:hypothetical protein